MENKGSSNHFNKLDRGPTYKHQHKIWSKYVHRFKRSKKWDITW